MDFKIQFEDAKIKAKELKYLNHYTTLNTLKIILNNRSLLLNRIDKVNDLMEHKRIGEFSNKKGFVSCFTSRERESYFFWKVYSHREEKQTGVRITFPISIIDCNDFYFDSECKKPLTVIKRAYSKCNHYDCEDDWGLLNHYASKIIYADSLNDFCYIDEWLKSNFGDCVNFKDETFEYNALPCLVKTSEWDSEEEIRIVAFVRPKGLETILGETCFVKNKYPQPRFDRIYLKLPEKILKDCIFTISPFCNEEYEHAISDIQSYDVTKACSINKSVMSVR